MINKLRPSGSPVLAAGDEFPPAAISTPYRADSKGVTVNNRMPTLVEDYRRDVAGLSTKEAKQVRALWHTTAKRYLNFLLLTSDTVASFPQADAQGIVPDYTRPLARAFLSRPIEELIDLYRVTKPKRAAQKKGGADFAAPPPYAG